MAWEAKARADWVLRSAWDVHLFADARQNRGGNINISTTVMKLVMCTRGAVKLSTS